MEPIASVRRVAILLLLGGSAGFAQSGLPAISPTAAPMGASSMGAPGEARVAHVAQVVYAGGKLEVSADNSSLNQILRDIARSTGLKITGGVVDERVYGKYGPAAPSEILENLLDGTNSNMMLRETSSNAPMELILTPRQGGPTPPSPNVAGGYSDDGARQQAEGPAPRPQAPAGQFSSQPLPVPEVPSGMTGEQPVTRVPRAPYPQPPAAVPGDNYPGIPQSPNDVPTPQQIYQQLQELQRSQPKQP